MRRKTVIALILAGVLLALVIFAALWALESESEHCFTYDDLGTVERCE